MPQSRIIENQRSCYIAHTHPGVHKILKTGFHESPMFNGTIKSIGPRYCPSIEDKIVTFSSKDRHQLFLEPEGVITNEYYINGFSSSLPWDVQLKALRQIPGLENVKFYRPGYAIEYDFFDPTQLDFTLHSKVIQNLYMAGQVNGTTGYEEAAAQGIIAGVNAHLKLNNKEQIILKRDEAYIGVLIDDLINKGVDEPYRMFTSRAEYRVLLRQDNADFRLTEKFYKVGLVSEERFQRFQQKKKFVEDLFQKIEKLSIDPSQIEPYLIKKNTSPLRQKMKLSKLLLRPQVRFQEIIEYLDTLKNETDQYGDLKDEVFSLIINNLSLLRIYKKN